MRTWARSTRSLAARSSASIAEARCDRYETECQQEMCVALNAAGSFHVCQLGVKSRHVQSRSW